MTASAAGDRAAEVLSAVRARGWTLAVAESLTGGALCSALVGVPGASDVLRGGVVAYATDLKQSLLGVDADLLAVRGPVDPDVALAMAQGARAVLDADVAVATTGVAGPGPADGRPEGTVFVAVATPTGHRCVGLALLGGRQQVRDATVAAALDLLVAELSGSA